MAEKRWRERILSSTRGRVLSLLRRGPRTINELADAVRLTDNAVRLHVASLERDGLVTQEGIRRGVGKPAHVYGLTSDAETLFPKAYASVLVEVLTYIREKDGVTGLNACLREIGRRMGERMAATTAAPGDRVDAAVALLNALGGLAEKDACDGAIVIRGYSCPLAAIVGDHPEVCGMAEELVGTVAGGQAIEHCDRKGQPRCFFQVKSLGETAV